MGSRRLGEGLRVAELQGTFGRARAQRRPTQLRLFCSLAEGAQTAALSDLRGRAPPASKETPLCYFARRLSCALQLERALACAGAFALAVCGRR